MRGDAAGARPARPRDQDDDRPSPGAVPRHCDPRMARAAPRCRDAHPRPRMGVDANARGMAIPRATPTSPARCARATRPAVSGCASGVHAARRMAVMRPSPIVAVALVLAASACRTAVPAKPVTESVDRARAVVVYVPLTPEILVV